MSQVWQDDGVVDVGTKPWGAVMVHVAVAVALLIGLVVPAYGATVADVVDQVANGVFVEDGAGQDADALAAVVADFADTESVIITVFAGGLASTPEEGADTLLRALPADTVLLFTPDDVAVASDVHDSGAIDAAFDTAGQAALDRDAAVASRALLLALTDEPTPLWVWLLLVLLVVGLAVGLKWFVDDRRRKRDTDRAFAAAQADFRSRLQTVAAKILDLEGLVTLADDPALSEELATATGLYQDVQWTFERADAVQGLEAVEPRLAKAEETLRRVEAKVA